LQHATPVTLGMKLAGWLGAVTRHRQRCRNCARACWCCSSAVPPAARGAGQQGDAGGRGLAEQLQLTLPEQPWHTQRDRLVEFASVLGLIAGSLGKFGRDVSLLMQTEAARCSSPRRRARAAPRPCRTSATRWARRC
jgi:3-carboxy-cis,cis-muconate cycloisomerase